MYKEKGNHIVTVVTEHKATLDPCKRLEKYGYRVTFLPVEKYGRVDSMSSSGPSTDKTILVSIMAANNEIGTLQPIPEIGKLCNERGVLFHTDAVQAVGKIHIDVTKRHRPVRFRGTKSTVPRGSAPVCPPQESAGPDFRDH